MKKILIFNSSSQQLPVLNTNASYDLCGNEAETIARAMSGEYSAVLVNSVCADEVMAAKLRGVRDITGTKIVTFISDDDTADRFLNAGLSVFCNASGLNSVLSDILDEHSTKKEKIIVKSLNKLKNIASSVNQGILIFDQNGRVTYCNIAAQSITGYAEAGLLFKTMDDIFAEHPYAECKDTGSIREQHKHVTVSGQELILDTMYSPTEDEGEYSGHVFLFSPSTASAMDRHQELEFLKFQDRYHSTQQHAAFQKQMLVIKDEVSGTLSGGYAFETYFKPLDVMSGDVYGSLNIKDGRYFFYIIDAMGKGLSASVTAVQSSSFINHSAELSILKNDFDMSKVISSFTRYIRDRLMEEEALCAIFATLDNRNDTLTIVSFGMPPILIYRKDGSTEKIRSQNMPIMRFMAERKATAISLSNVEKFLIYSDGLSEAETVSGKLYFEMLPEHFASSATKRHLLKKFNDNVLVNDDDLTFFFISTTSPKIIKSDSFSVLSSPTELAIAERRIESFMKDAGAHENDVLTMTFALGEMLMNALEHGSLGISFEKKKMMLSEGVFDQYISEHAVDGTVDYKKQINISCKIIKRPGLDNDILVVIIKDEGQGFNVSEIFKFHSFDGNLCHIDSRNYNGRGIFITDNMVDGLFYNTTGNCVYIIKILG